jgi:hypothetical protein
MYGERRTTMILKHMPLRFGLLGLLLFLASAPVMMAQTTATTGALTGLVTDPSGAVVPKAKATLKSKTTGAMVTTDGNASGQYSFPAVAPGTYTLSVAADGFQTSVVDGVVVELAKSGLINVVLKLGSVAETVTVAATAQAYLQTTDASVSNVIGSQEVQDLPTVTRRAVELVFLQPGAQPWTGGAYNGSSGTIAGAQGDQNTFTLDGLDISDSQVGGECCGNVGAGIPLPVEAIEQFNSSVTNQNANFARSAGGDFAFAVKHGTPEYHGAAYWYHVDDHLVANTWAADRLQQPKAKFLDNRGGFRLGGPLLGPVLRDKLFFFLNMELRRFPNSSQVNGLVPTPSLRAGILRFRDGTGNIVSYDLATSTLCGTSGNLPCDPRGVGISPVIADQFNLLPPGNDSSLGDQLNTTGISGPATSAQHNDNAVARIDYTISPKWRANGLWSWAENTFFNPFNNPGIDWRGGPSHIITTASIDNHPRLYAFGLTGELSPTTVNEFHVGFNQSTIQFVQPHPTTLLQGAGVALHLPVIQDPIQINGARAQLGISRTWQFADTLTKVLGRHQLQFGVNYQHLYFLQNREGANIYNIFPVAEIGTNQFVPVSNSQRPPTCGTATTANCLLPNDISLWNNLYAATLGIVDSVNDIVVRNPNGTAEPTGTPLNTAGIWHHFEYHVSDIWRLTNSLSLSLGLMGTMETPFSDNNGRQTFITNAQTGQLIDPVQYLNQRAAMARLGQVYNPGFAWSPISNFAGRGYFPLQNHVGPRLAAAWNPSFRQGILDRIFGDRKGVIRGGYGLAYFRALAVGEVQFAQEGDQLLAQTNPLVAPSNGAGQNFRVGVDGPAPLPVAAPQIASPYIPPSNYGAGFLLAFDPNYKVASMHSVNFTYQREFPGNVLVEVGYMGRFARHIETSLDLNAVPFFIADLSHKSSQNFAQAFDQVAMQLRNGVSPASVSPQPWFENSIGPGATVQLATTDSSDFISAFVKNLWQNHIDPLLSTKVENQQLVGTLDISPVGWSNYNAMFLSFNKRTSHGLTFTLNYTLSKWNSTGENSTDGGAGVPVNSYNLNYSYGPALGDRRHVISAYGVYDLPFGPGHRYTGGSLRRLVEGWHWSNVMTFASGLPLGVSMGGQPFGSNSFYESIPAKGGLNTSTGRHTNVPGSNGIGTAGNPANGGSGLNLFADPSAAYADFRPFLISQDTSTSQGFIRGLSRFTWDTSLIKDLRVTERVRFRLGFDFFNVLNHPLFQDPSLNYLDPTSFGVISSQPGDPANGDYWTPRRVQVSLRLEF